MNRFEQTLAEHYLTLRRERLQTLQINVGRKCNQACRHCHVDAAPWRTEMMDEPTAHRIGDWIVQHRPEIVDLTGGAPELSEFFRYFVETARAAGAEVIDRNNLTIIEAEGYGWLPEYLAEHQAQVIASLPCYSAENVINNAATACLKKALPRSESSTASATARHCRSIWCITRSARNCPDHKPIWKPIIKRF